MPRTPPDGERWTVQPTRWKDVDGLTTTRCAEGGGLPPRAGDGA